MSSLSNRYILSRVCHLREGPSKGAPINRGPHIGVSRNNTLTIPGSESSPVERRMSSSHILNPSDQEEVSPLLHSNSHDNLGQLLPQTGSFLALI